MVEISMEESSRSLTPVTIWLSCIEEREAWHQNGEGKRVGKRKKRGWRKAHEELCSVFLSLLLKSRRDSLVASFRSSVGPVVVVFGSRRTISSALETRFLLRRAVETTVELTFVPCPPQRSLLQRRSQTDLHRPSKTDSQRLLLLLQAGEEWGGRIEERGSKGSVGGGGRRTRQG